MASQSQKSALPKRPIPASVTKRFTAHLSDQERIAIRIMAEQHNTSENFIVRNAIRAFVGLSVNSEFERYTP